MSNMEIDLDSMKTSLATLLLNVLSDNDYMTGTAVSEQHHVHPDVGLSIPWAAYFVPSALIYSGFVYMFPPFGYLATLALIYGRLGWFIAHAWHIFWWSILFNLFFQFFWVWILESWGWIEADWFW